jgi:hypothetical protein
MATAEYTAAMTSTMIQREAALLDLCDELREQPWVALDTEFLRERTYYAQLCLIQIATPERIACVDPLALRELDPLLAVLDGSTRKVLHSPRQDLELYLSSPRDTPAPTGRRGRWRRSSSNMRSTTSVTCATCTCDCTTNSAPPTSSHGSKRNVRV